MKEIDKSIIYENLKKCPILMSLVTEKWINKELGRPVTSRENYLSEPEKKKKLTNKN